MLDHNIWMFVRVVLPPVVEEYGRRAWALRCVATKRVELVAAPPEGRTAEAADMGPAFRDKPAGIERGKAWKDWVRSRPGSWRTAEAMPTTRYRGTCRMSNASSNQATPVPVR